MRNESERDRYVSMSSHHPDIRFMVWDYYGNDAVAYSYEERHADQVAEALNAMSTIWWDENKKTWMDGDEKAHIKEHRKLQEETRSNPEQ